MRRKLEVGIASTEKGTNIAKIIKSFFILRNRLKASPQAEEL